MTPFCKKLLRQSGLVRWVREDDAVAAIEAGLLFPIMFSLLVGMIDMGNGIIAGQKTLRASQVIADLITRKDSVSDSDINDAIEAGKLALQPYDSSGLCVYINSIRFDENADPQSVWSEQTANDCVNNQAVQNTDAMGASEGDGVVVVAVKYTFVPWFVDVVIGTLHFSEVAYARGRKSPVVEHD